MIFFLLLLLVPAVFADISTVRGVLACQGKTLANVTIALWERDIDPDDHLNTVVSRENGEFEIIGEEHEFIGDIEPYILIDHTCNVKAGCKRITKYNVPKAYSNRIYEMTIIILDIPSLEDNIICPED